jgi:hypothetical protein
MRTLYDGELCKVEFLKIYDYADLNYGTQDLGYVYLQLRIENKTDSKVMAYLKDCSINGFTVTALSGMTPNIGAGEKLQTAYFFNYSATDISNKSQIETIKFKVNLQNEYFSSVFLSDEFVLTF